MLYKDKPWINPYESRKFTPTLPTNLSSIHDPTTYGISRAGFNIAGYRTTSNDYGKYPPSRAMLPTSAYPRNMHFTKHHIPKPEEGRMNI
ncbi:uncharacterized protein LOC129593295 [Paramacrobiotus metropolitanus]|uniref:uncharacterized protein LOC129593295 n=1 Tax=Paramacrobiotus metropolitanus TaxID=2943436 RepID=UPI0024457B6B|nr:uncharacterized protein LOC129593295 [Paramacrobiotus metropolitanus]